MTLLFSETFEEGTNGTAITTADSNFTNFVAAGTWVFSNAHLVPGYGSMSGKSTASAGTAIANAGNTAWASKPVTFWDQAFYVESTPTSNASIVNARNGATATADLRLLATGAVQLRVNNVQVAVSAAGIAVTGKKVRVRFELNSTAQKVQLQVWGNAHFSAASPDYDSGLVSVSSLTATTNFQVGFVSSTTGILHWAGFAVDDAAYPGPSLGNIPPTCSVSVSPNPVAAGGTFTLTGTDNDPDGTIVSRAWTPSTGLTGASTATATGTAPSVSGGTTQTYTYTVTDNLGATASSTVNLSVLSSTATIAPRDSAQATNTTTGTTTSVTIPSTVVAGDKMIAIFMDGGGSLTESLPAAWAPIGSEVSAANYGLHMWAKTAVAGDAGSTLTVTSSLDGSTVSKRTFDVLAYSGAKVGNARAIPESTAGTAHTAPGADAISPNAWAITVFMDRGSPGSTSISVPAGWTVRRSFAHTGGAAITSTIADKATIGSGTVGAVVGTGTISTANAAMATIILEPGTATNPPPTVVVGADQANINPGGSFTVGGTDVAQGTATVASILWEELSGADLGDLTGYTTGTITLTAPITLYGTSLVLQKTVTDSTGVSAVAQVQVDVLPAPLRAIQNGVEVPCLLYAVTT